MLKNLVGVSIAAALVLTIGCKQELPADVKQDSIFGTVQELNFADNEKMLVYQTGEDPSKKNWGLAGGYYITVEGKRYLLHWEHLDKFKALKVGDKVNLHPSGYIACVGESDLKPVCYRMMKVYASERRIDPLQTR